MVVSHMGASGGDTPEIKRVQTGLLGCDYEVADGRYAFAARLQRENWNPQLLAPLTQPAVNGVFPRPRRIPRRASGPEPIPPRTTSTPTGKGWTTS